MKIFLIIYLITTFLGYLALIYSKYGILESISDSYYVMKNKWLFTLFIWSTGFSFIFLGETPLMFFAGTALCFAGTAAAFKESLTGTVHVVGAVSAICLGMLSLILDFKMGWLLFPYILYVLVFWLGKLKNETYWIEVGAFVTVIVGLILSNSNG